jgi:hypothetical protein
MVDAMPEIAARPANDARGAIVRFSCFTKSTAVMRVTLKDDYSK